MGQFDRNNQGVPQGSYKRDWNLYIGGGSGGGTGATVTGTTRYTFWIDHSKFMTFLRKLITQNVSFNIYTDSGATIKAPVYIGVAQSDDIPDAVIQSQGLYIDPAVLVPPYFINTTFLTQPTDFNYQNDQGRYVYNAYSGNGLGTGNSGKIVQSFIPQSPFQTAVWFKRLFHVGSNSDHTLYNDLIVELWDTNKNVIATATISKYALQVDPTDSNVEYYVTADDGLRYWIDFDQRRVRFSSPVKVTPGVVHYICVKQDTSSVAHHYGIGSNTSPAGNWDQNLSTYYINGQAYTAPYASTVLTAIGSNISICFVTQRNNGRTAITFQWASAGYYWFNPSGNVDQFRFVKEDVDKRI